MPASLCAGRSCHGDAASTVAGVALAGLAKRCASCRVLAHVMHVMRRLAPLFEDNVATESYRDDDAAGDEDSDSAGSDGA